MNDTGTGSPFPLGASKTPTGWNFAVYSESPVQALLLAPLSSPTQIETFPLNPITNRTGCIWHIAIPLDAPAIYYGYHVEFQGKTMLLFDPYARLLNTGHTFQKNSYSNTELIGMAISDPPFDWENDRHPRIARQDLIIYEMHIRGFTNHPSSKVASPGTFSGIVQKIPYFKELGVNALELLPIMEFNESENHNVNPKTNKELCNFWGYSPLSFFSPMQRYASSSNPQESLNECKAMVKALHKAGIEVILDVVFNHTGEGNEQGPVWSWKGFADSVYYLKNGSGEYLNYSGCGNTLNCNHPIVADMIIEALRYWVVEFRVDGFRFDLASILTRGQDGRILESAPLIERITQDPILSHCKLIAEAWDAAGLHQVGSFYQSTWQGPEEWMEWNDDFRSVVRCFLKGTPGYVGRFTTKLCGSEDYYGKGGSPLNSTNYVTCHDGFTLRDLVSYNQKHNEENGEQNRDGMNNNDSWNCGAEGDTSDSHIEVFRERQIKNFWLALFVSAGVPMIMMGDEYGHTKNGNNNSWCHDDDKNWFLWDELEGTNSPYRFCKEMIRFRKSCPLLKRSSFYQKQDVAWYGKEGAADWSPESQFIALHIKDRTEGNDLYIAFNAYPKICKLPLPPLPPDKQWIMVANTSELAPNDIATEPMARKLVKEKIEMAPYSSLLLQALAR